MSTPAPPHRPDRSVRIVRRFGDPFEAESAEGDPAASEPEDVALLNRMFYDSSVDIGGVVRIGPRTYVCTKLGWRVAARM
jgi:hypothetical protein